MMQPMASNRMLLHHHHHHHHHRHRHCHHLLPVPSPTISASSSPYLCAQHSLLPRTTLSAWAPKKQLDSIALSRASRFDQHGPPFTNLPLVKRDDGEDDRRKEAMTNHSLVVDSSKPHCVQTDQQEDIDNNVTSLRNISHLTLAILVMGLISCPHAWASTEVASLQEVGSWIDDLDGIKNGFISAFLLIFFSEIGDKTFFIAALLASRKSNVAVFIGTFGALVVMTFISVFLGRTFHYIDEILPLSLGENELPLDDLAAAVLLLYFGASTLLDATTMEGSKAEEEQQEAELAVAGLSGNGQGSAIISTGLATFALVFVAEWGDKSFFSTIALSAASSPFGVVSGAVVGHGVATLLAVLGGSFLSTYISEKAIAYIGGVLFLVFAAFTLFETFN